MPGSNPSLLNSKEKKKAADFYSGILQNNRTVLSKAITLCESQKEEHRKLSGSILEKCYPHSGNSLRIGITGAPGVGKSTFIEALGTFLTTKGKKTAVLAIDPSSKKNSGSILGDKTRMDNLSASENAFIRPSPSSGEFGGTGPATRESIILCEAAGYEIIFIETVGVGQSETEVNAMVDFFILLTMAGAGDDLQGIKRGIMEMAELVIINKTDIGRTPLGKGNQDAEGLLFKSQLSNALKMFPKHEGKWEVKVLSCSSLTGKGIKEIWKEIENYFLVVKKNGYFLSKRKNQLLSWFSDKLEKGLKNYFLGNDEVRKSIGKMEKEILNGATLPGIAANNILKKLPKHLFLNTSKNF